MDANTTILVIAGLLSAGMVLPISMLFYLFWSGKDKSKFLYYETEDNCRLIDKEIKDGKVVITDNGIEKHFFLDNAKPKIIKTFFGLKSFYQIKWNAIAPLAIDFKANTLTDGKITPENLGQLKKSTIIEKLMNPKTSDMNIILWLIVGVVIGALLGYVASKGF
jgi:hypothetical protein